MSCAPANATKYSTITEAQRVFRSLLADAVLPLPAALRASTFSDSIAIHGVDGTPTIPTPWRETEAITALKALEAALAMELGRVRFDIEQTAEVDVDHATIFLFMSYLSTLDGFGKWDKQSVARLKPTDLYRAQSNLYRRLSANMYRTKEPDVYYHLHGSLEATPILEMIGLPGYRDELEDYDERCSIIQGHCQNFTAQELDAGTEDRKQAGAIIYKQEDFLATEQGKAISSAPLFSCEQLEGESPPASFPASSVDVASGNAQLLEGIKVLDLTRVIAGPVITRTLAEYGASVIKVTSPNLPDVPYYAVDLNFGKATVDLDLHDPTDRARFEKLLDDVDVVVDGYRAGALERLGYGVDSLKERFAKREKGFVYVAENCFGFKGPWKERSGWQPVADAVSGLAWGHGQAIGLNEPVLPPYPCSDYGTGELGAIAALNALYRRATEGGSYFAGVSLTQYNLWIMSLQPYPAEVWSDMLAAHKPEMAELGHLSNFDVVSKSAIRSMRRLHPRLFDENYMFEMYSEGFKSTVRSCRPVVKLSRTRNWWKNTTRPNGYDRPEWP